MNTATIIVLSLVLTGLGLSLRFLRKTGGKKSCSGGGCTCDCRDCEKRKF